MRVALVALLLVAAVAGSGADAARPLAHPCRTALPRGPAVPSPLIVWDSCGVFHLAGDGKVTHLPRHWLALHGGGTGRRFGADLQLRRSHAGAYVLLRHGRTLWHSHGLYPNDYTGVAFGPGLFAFGSYTHRGIFLTDLRSPERMVARGRAVYPLGFTGRGMLLVDGGHAILVIGPSGKLLRRYRYARRRGFAFDDWRGVLSFVTRGGALAEVRNGRAHVVGRAPAIPAWPNLLAPGLLAWPRAHQVVITNRSGDVVAHARWPARRGAMDLGVYASSDGTLFAYRVTKASPGARRPSATVYVLSRGGRTGRLLVTHQAAKPGCGGIPGGLGWSGHDLLYDFGDGRVAVFDVDSGARTDLATFVRAIPRRDPGESVAFAWASSFTR
jgi:hypothetical protein